MNIILKPDEIVELKLIEKVEVTHDTNRYRFGFPNEDDVLGLPTGKHIALTFEDEYGEPVSRSYTPVSSDVDKGFVDFVIKVYRSNVHPDFPEGGVMSQKIDKLEIGDSFSFRGPNGRLEYMGDGVFNIKQLKSQGGEIIEKKVKNVGMIAGGTGITPMIQIIRAVLRNENDPTKLSLLFANKEERDIILRDKLENPDRDFSDRFEVHYTLDKAENGWSGFTGFIDEEMIRNTMLVWTTDFDWDSWNASPENMMEFCTNNSYPALDVAAAWEFVLCLGIVFTVASFLFDLKSPIDFHSEEE